MTKPRQQSKPKKPYVQPDLKKDQQLKKITEGAVVSVCGPGDEPNDLPK